MKKRMLIALIPISLAGIAGIASLFPSWSEQDKALYISLFCSVRNSEPRLYELKMMRLLQGGSLRYSSVNTPYLPVLGHEMVKTFHRLPGHEKSRAYQSERKCRMIMYTHLR